MKENQNKIVLITGAARRLGAELSRHLHDLGCRIVIHYRNSAAEAHALRDALNKKRADSAMVLQADLLNISDYPILLQKIIDTWGGLDILINNASEFYKTELGNLPESQWDCLLDTNVKAPFFLAQHASKFIKKQNGCIINITDVHGERPLKDYAIYSISKAALIMMTKSLAKELAPDVRVNAVSPSGGMCWPEGENSLDQAAKEKIINRTALKREGSAKDIAKAVSYLIAAEYVTGQILAVDGGRL